MTAASFAALRERIKAQRPIEIDGEPRLSSRVIARDTIDVVLALLDAEAAAPAAGDALAEMERRKDEAYHERNQVVAGLAAVALANGWRTGTARTAIEGWSEDWHGCVYIDLPTGQVSWHFHDSQAGLFAFLPPYVAPWDGHDTPEKYRRVLALAEAAAQPAAPADVADKLVAALRAFKLHAFTSPDATVTIGDAAMGELLDYAEAIRTARAGDGGGEK